jgi:hypothetical protein
MSIPDFDTAPHIVGRNIRDALLSSSSSTASLEVLPTPAPQLRLPTGSSPHIKVIRRGKGARKKYSVHHRARGGGEMI